MKVLITGANGQLAKEFQRYLEVKNIFYLALPKEKLDITDFFFLKEVIENFKPTLVINCAAYNQVNLAETDYEKAYQVNALAPYSLAVLSKEKNFLIHYSTDYMFDGERKKCYTEKDKPNPINKYGKTKLF